MNAEVLTEADLKKEKERLAALYEYNILDTEPEEAYNKIVEIASYICGTPISLITLLETDRQWFKAKKGFEVSETSRDISFCHHAIKDDHLMEVPDALQDERFKTNPLVADDPPNIRFYAGSPLITPDGHKLGTLCVLDKKPRTLTAEQKAILDTLAAQVVTQLELQKQKKQLQSLNSGLLKELETKIEEQNRVLHLFTRFVPDEIVSRHLQSTEEVADDAESKYLTVLFCDMRGYTSIVEKLSPRETVNILRSYYTIMSDVISTYSGMVNQYVGDEIFATFGAPFTFPPYERNAVFCALDMLEKLKELNEACHEHAKGQIKIGIGIHAGEVVTGTLGSRNKIEYAVTGDTVNTGKRIESLTQGQPNTILISQAIYEKVSEWIEVAPWEPITVKGKTEPIQIYQVLRRKS